MSNNLDEKNEKLTKSRADAAEYREVITETERSLSEERANFD